jgi:hypothetical protein
MIITVKEGITVEHTASDPPTLWLDPYRGSNVVGKVGVELPAELRDALIRALMGPPKYGIMHASDRPLGTDVNGQEVWGADGRLVLFATVAEAEAHIEKRIAQYPNGDWCFATVQMHTPGVRLYPQWAEVPERRVMKEADIIVGRRYGGRIVLRANRYEDRWEMSEAEFEALKAKHPGARVVDLTLKETL